MKKLLSPFDRNLNRNIEVMPPDCKFDQTQQRNFKISTYEPNQCKDPCSNPCGDSRVNSAFQLYEVVNTNIGPTWGLVVKVP